MSARIMDSVRMRAEATLEGRRSAMERRDCLEMAVSFCWIIRRRAMERRSCTLSLDLSGG